jgi:hypothetical protein
VVCRQVGLLVPLFVAWKTCRQWLDKKLKIRKVTVLFHIKPLCVSLKHRLIILCIKSIVESMKLSQSCRQGKHCSIEMKKNYFYSLFYQRPM